MNRVVRQAGRGGFTLIELLAVVILMGILMTVAALSWPRMSLGYRIDDTVRRAADILEHARAVAISSRTPSRFIYNDGARFNAQGNWSVYVANPMMMVAVSNNFYSSEYSGLTDTFMILPMYQPRENTTGDTGPTGIRSWTDTAKGYIPLGVMVSVRAPLGHVNATNSFVGQADCRKQYSSQPEVYYLDFPNLSDPRRMRHAPLRMPNCSWVGFNPHGEADVTATVIVHEVSAKTGAWFPGARSARVITEAGSGRIRTVKP